MCWGGGGLEMYPSKYKTTERNKGGMDRARGQEARASRHRRQSSTCVGLGPIPTRVCDAGNFPSEHVAHAS